MKTTPIRSARALSAAALPAAFALAIALVAGSFAAGCSDDAEGPLDPENPDAAFDSLGDLPGGEFHSEALAISDDGTTVVGRSASSHSSEEGFIWTAAGGSLVAMLGPGGTHVAGEPRAITPHGTIAAGKFATTATPLQAGRWTSAVGWVALDDLPGGDAIGQALGISESGSVIVGWGASAAGLEAMRWVNGVPTPMGDLDGGTYQSAASNVSADGATIVGTGTSASGPEVFTWTTFFGMHGLGDLAGGTFSSEPFGMTPDASVIVGEATSASGIEAFRWTSAGGMIGLGDLPGGATECRAFDVSADGKIVVGSGTTDAGAEAFVWDVAHGMRRLEDVLVAAGLEAVATWQLYEATGISADGRTIIGNGTNASGESEAWIARLPK